ncbi:hypothetical protein DFH09DRAFT_422310 [Mycena vulgaris]|nr:hypothetical protein DFH09DRAFT_422310 [Mycena vulgaris]
MRRPSAFPQLYLVPFPLHRPHVQKSLPDSQMTVYPLSGSSPRTGSQHVPKRPTSFSHSADSALAGAALARTAHERHCLGPLPAPALSMSRSDRLPSLIQLTPLWRAPRWLAQLTTGICSSSRKLDSGSPYLSGGLSSRARISVNRSGLCRRESGRRSLRQNYLPDVLEFATPLTWYFASHTLTFRDIGPYRGRLFISGQH